MAKINKSNKQSSTSTITLSDKILRVYFIRSHVRFLYPDEFSLLKEMVEADSDSDMCIHCAAILLGLPYNALLDLVTNDILKGDKSDPHPIIRVQDLLTVVDFEEDDYEFLK
jgi:hypothetical protein